MFSLQVAACAYWFGEVPATSQHTKDIHPTVKKGPGREPFTIDQTNNKRQQGQ